MPSSNHGRPPHHFAVNRRTFLKRVGGGLGAAAFVAGARGGPAFAPSPPAHPHWVAPRPQPPQPGGALAPGAGRGPPGGGPRPAQAGGPFLVSRLVSKRHPR